MLDTRTDDRRTLPAHHEGPVTALALVDLLHHQSYHGGLQHHALVSGGGRDDRWSEWASLIGPGLYRLCSDWLDLDVADASSPMP